MSNNTFQKVKFHILAILCLFFISEVFSSHLSAADWVQVYRKPGGTFREVCHANGLFVAVGDEGLLMTSANGLDWTVRNPGTTLGLYCITYGQGKFVVVGYHGIIITSTDGINWTQRNPANGTNLLGVTYNGTDLFVTVGYSGRIMTSPNGITWTDQTRFSTAKHYDVCWGNGRYVASSDSGRIYSSPDGVNWVQASVNTGTNNPSAIYGGGLFVVGGHGVIHTSPDGINWTKRNPDTTNYFHDLTYTGSHYIGCGNADGYGCSMIQVSPTTTSWVRDRTPDYSVLAGIAHNGTRIVAVGTRRLIITNTVGGVGDGLGCGGGGGATKTITVNAPNGGEKLAIGSSYTIKWSSANVTDTVRIRYSTNNGSSWTIITSSTENNGSYNWAVPDVNSSQCLVRINAVNTDGTPYDVSNSTFTIGDAASDTLTVTAPTSGDVLTANNIYTIRWESTGSVGNVKLWYSINGNYTKIEHSTANDGIYEWNVPNISSDKCKIRVSESTDGDPFDESGTFSIKPPYNRWITVTSPNGGEVWAKNSTENITWTTTGSVGNVAIQYSVNNGFNWTTLVSSTANDGSYTWTVPDIISAKCLVKIYEVSTPEVSDISNSGFTIGGPAQIILNRDRFNFGYINNGASTCVQTLYIYNGGGGTLNWTVGADASWINLYPSSGMGGGAVTIGINTLGLTTGFYEGTITVSDPNVSNSPQTAVVYLTVKNGSQDQIPFGTFATPEDGLTGVSGSIAVTGWALDDTCVESVKIYRQVNGGLSYIGDAVFVEGPRPDVEEAYPDYPNNYKAGWGYMMLTNFLPDGKLIIKAIAKDNTGHQVELGTKTITVDNANAIKPFGAIDTPTQGGEAFGTKYRNNGWALTPQPNKIPENGSSIKVWIDGKFVDTVNYNLYRSDIAGLFSGYANTDGAWAFLDFDTTAYSNGVHTIAWSVMDSAGNTDGVGSRYFSIQNIGGASGSSTQGMPGITTTTTHGDQWPDRLTPTKDIPMRDFGFVKVKRGFNQEREPQKILLNEEGVVALQAYELERIEIQLNKNVSHGYMEVGSQLRPLPIGSSLDTKKGIFYWLLGPGFLGHYELVFVGKQETGEPFMMKVHLNIHPGHFGKYRKVQTDK